MSINKFFEEALLLSKQMLQAVNDNNINLLTELDVQRNSNLQQIHSYLAKQTKLSEPEITAMQQLLALNKNLIDIVTLKQDSFKQKLKTIKQGQKAKDSYNLKD